MALTKRKVTLNLKDFEDNALRKEIVEVTQSLSEYWYDDDNLVVNKKQVFEADNTGLIEMELVETDTGNGGSTGDLYYIVNVANIKKERVYIPDGSGDLKYKDLVRVT